MMAEIPTPKINIRWNLRFLSYNCFVFSRTYNMILPLLVITEKLVTAVAYIILPLTVNIAGLSPN